MFKIIEHTKEEINLAESLQSFIRAKISSNKRTIYFKDNDKIGYLAEFAVRDYFIKLGFTVYFDISIGRGNDYDMTIEKGGIKYTVEVKNKRYDNGKPSLDWIFNLSDKQVDKVFDRIENKIKVDIVVFVGYSTKENKSIIYGVMSGKKMLHLHRTGEAKEYTKKFDYTDNNGKVKQGEEKGIEYKYKMFSNIDDLPNTIHKLKVAS